jgi:hypothetical protein
VTILPPDVKAFARGLGGEFSEEENGAMFLNRACRKLGTSPETLGELGVNEKMALMAYLSISILKSNGN